MGIGPSTVLQLPAEADIGQCVDFFQPDLILDSLHNIWATYCQVAVVVIFIGIFFFRKTVRDDPDGAEPGGSVGELLKAHYNTRLVFGFGFQIAALILDGRNGGLSTKNLRISHALASLYGIQAIITGVLIWRSSVWRKRRYLYLGLFTALFIYYTIRVCLRISEGVEALCLRNSGTFRVMATKNTALATVISTLIWHLLMTITLVLGSTPRFEFRAWRFTTFVLAYTCAAAQIFYLWAQIDIYRLRYYSIILRDAEGSSSRVDQLSLEYPTLAQLVNYIMVAYPVLDLIAAGIRRANRKKPKYPGTPESSELMEMDHRM